MDNRQRFKDLLKAHKIPQTESAKLIEAVTKRPCSARAVRSWLADAEVASARPCPDWAVKALEKAIEYMQHILEQRARQDAAAREKDFQAILSDDKRV